MYRDRPAECPRCRIVLDPTEGSDQWRCPRCAGRLLSLAEVVEALLRVAPDLRPASGTYRLTTLSRRTDAAALPCARCNALMDPVFLGGVEVERCRADELFWFDSAELERVIVVATEQRATREASALRRALRHLFGP